MSNADPILNNWYQDAETNRNFRIVALEGDSIEVQYANGDLGEYDTASWYESAVFPIEPEEDWSAPYGDLEVDDLGYTDPDRHGFDPQEMTLDDLLDEDLEG